MAAVSPLDNSPSDLHHAGPMLLAQAMVESDSGPLAWLMSPTVLLLAGGGVGLYLAARAGTAALIGRGGFGAARSGTVALGQWVPIATVAVVALLLGRPDIALGVTFASSVAALSLAIGMITFLVPDEPIPATRRGWSFVLPAALLAMLAGFGGGLNPLHAILIGGLGLTVWSVWSAAAREEGDVAQLLGELKPADAASPPVWRSWRVLLGGGAVVVTAGAAWGVVEGTILADQTLPIRATLLAAGAISPLLTLPLLAAGTEMAQRNRSGEACSACVGVALLNLLALLPMLVLLWWARLAMKGLAWPAVPFPPLPSPSSSSAMSRGVLSQGWDVAAHYLRALPSLPMPIIVWRIDTVILTVLGFALIPAAMGLWRIRRLEAMALVLAYAAYLGWTAYLVSRVGGI